MRRVVAFVLGYRAINDLRNGTIESILDAAANIPASETWVMYVDNYSRDGSVQWITQHHHAVELLLARSNLFYCGGVNAGLQYASRRFDPDYYLLIDADNPCQPDAYAELVRFADEHPPSAMVQPLVRSRANPGIIYSCGHRFLEDGQCRPLQAIPDDPSALLRLQSCSISSTLLRASALRECGILNPIFDIYFESSDLAFRLRAGGYDCSCHTGAVAYNEGTDGQGVDRVHNRYYFHRNRIIFWKLHDEEKFLHVKELLQPVLDDLQARFEASRFGLDAESEPVRAGIQDGLHVAADPGLMTRPPIRLDDFDKGRLIRIQEGRPVSGSTR